VKQILTKYVKYSFSIKWAIYIFLLIILSVSANVKLYPNELEFYEDDSAIANADKV
jgi:uncharacterized membrane protein